MTPMRAYQAWTEETAIYPEANTQSVNELMYLGLGFAGEAGEVANVVKKLYRDGDSPAQREKLQAELGDTLWYAARLAEALGTDLETLAAANKAKLQSRQQRQVLTGSGDNR